MNVGGAIVEPLAKPLHIRLVTLVVERIGLGNTHDVTSFDTPRFNKADRFELPGCESNEFVIGRIPELVAFEDEVFETETGAPFLHHVRRPRTEVLNSPHDHCWRVDVNPIVGESGALGYDERDGKEVAVAQVVGGCQDIGRGRRIHCLQERRHGHR